MRYILVCLALLSGCTWGLKPDAIITEKVVHVDARALEPCANLTTLNESASFEELMNVTFTNFQVYSECKAKQDNSIKLLKQFSNYKEPSK